MDLRKKYHRADSVQATGQDKGAQHMSNRYKRLMVPWSKETPDAKGFFNYAKEHYETCIQLALEIAIKCGASRIGVNLIVRMVFDKLASPLVYLYEAWEVLNPEEKAKYSLEMAKIHEESKKLAEEVFGK